MQVSQDVMAVLDRAAFDGPRLSLTPVGQLDRKLYTDVNKVIEAAGGVWNRSAKAHVFDGDAAEIMEPIIATGEYSRIKQDLGQFDTPPEIASMVVALAFLRDGMTVLEPSAGMGNLARVANEQADDLEITCYEIDPTRASLLDALGDFYVWQENFLGAEPESFDFQFDRVIMNPPFAGQVDIDHVLHAAKFLKPGGRLVAIMSAGVTFRTNRKTVEFREIVEANGGTIELLPEGAFAATGTQVRTCVVAFNVGAG